MPSDAPALVWEMPAELGEGPVWVERDQALWFVDIKKQQVHRYDPATGGATIEVADIHDDGTLGGRRPFARIDPQNGHPDGPTIDSDGHVWISLYAGWEAWRYAPNGERVARVRFPVANITKIAFGGEG